MFHVTYCGYHINNPDYDIIHRPFGSSDYLLVSFMSEMTVELNGNKVHASSGDFLLYPPGARQWYQAKRKFKNSFVHFTDDSSFIEELHLPYNQLFRVDETSVIQEYFRLIEQEFINCSPFHTYQNDANVRSLLIELYRKVNVTLTPDLHTSRRHAFERIRLEILSHLDHEWNAKKMADLAHMSISHFYQIYQQEFNQSPKAELIEARMDYARYLLLNESLQVSEIARMVGYENEFHFIRHFRQLFDITPKQYAKQYLDLRK